MESLRVELSHCYGIRKLEFTFNFNSNNAVAIYAPNGVMKSSLAKTFQDISDNKESYDRMFQDRANKRTVVDENENELDPKSILIVRPYDEDFGGGESERISTLLVNAKLRREYESLNSNVDRVKDVLMKAVKQQAGTRRRDLEAEISSTFTRKTDQFQPAILRIAQEVEDQPDAPFSEIPYDLVFDTKVVEMLEREDIRTNIAQYVTRLNELLDKSTYFKRGTFTYYNASTIAKHLAQNGFFAASHSVNLNADEKIEIKTAQQLTKLIESEKAEITADDELRSKFSIIESSLYKNNNVREFSTYVTHHEEILPMLSNVEDFKEQVWKSYFVRQKEIFNEFVREIRRANARRKEIEEAAKSERTAWQEVIEIFNQRFFVPFELRVNNHISMVLYKEKIPKLDFIFKEGEHRKEVEKNALVDVLSTGELRAFYLLNVIFDIRARQKMGQETLLVVDDIADSFDYKNKFAIIQYLKEISEREDFRQIILTHNFDFFRTLQSRFVTYNACFMAYRTEEGIEITKAIGVKNIFVNDWKKNFGCDPRKRIACIPFMRNLLEYTEGTKAPDYEILTSLLHMKENTDTIPDSDLFDLFEKIFREKPVQTTLLDGTVLELIYQEADKCVDAAVGVNFENKIVLSIAARLLAEQFMMIRCTGSLPDDDFDGNQTTRLLRCFVENFPNELDAIRVIEQIILMTPENIHLNSFMYEPILDMSDEHLRKVYVEIKTLCSNENL